MVPQWATQVQVDTLDIRSSKQCVLGQLFGSYGKGLKELGLTASQSTIYGFLSWGNLLGIHLFTRRDPLTPAWRELIRERQRRTPITV